MVNTQKSSLLDLFEWKFIIAADPNWNSSGFTLTIDWDMKSGSFQWRES